MTKVFDSRIFLKLSRKMRRSKTETLICRDLVSREMKLKRVECFSARFLLTLACRDPIEAQCTCTKPGMGSMSPMALQSSNMQFCQIVRYHMVLLALDPTSCIFSGKCALQTTCSGYLLETMGSFYPYYYCY